MNLKPFFYLGTNLEGGFSLVPLKGTHSSLPFLIDSINPSGHPLAPWTLNDSYAKEHDFITRCKTKANNNAWTTYTVDFLAPLEGKVTKTPGINPTNNSAATKDLHIY